MKKVFLITILFASLYSNATDFTDNGINYEFVSVAEKTAKVISRTNGNLTNVVIPDEVIYNTQPLKVIEIADNAFSQSYDIKSVVVGDNVVSIGASAFNKCTSMETFVLGSNVESLGMNCLAGCTSLKNLELKDGPKPLICNYIFGSSLKSPFADAPLESLHLGRQLPVGSYRSDLSMFGKKTTLRELTIGSFVTTIDDEWFNNCNITEVSIPDGCTLGASAFKYCYSLKLVTIGNNVIMQQQPFFYCTGIETITFGKGVMAWMAYNKFVQSKKIRKVISYSDSPITGIEFESDVYVHGEAIVPKGALQPYKSNSIWGQFWNIHEVEDSGVDDNLANENIRIIVNNTGITLTNALNLSVVISSINGVLVERIKSYSGEDIELEHGVYILKIGPVIKKIII